MSTIDLGNFSRLLSLYFHAVCIGKSPLFFALLIEILHAIIQVKRWTDKRLSIQQRKARVAEKKAAFIAAHGAAAALAGDDDDEEDMEDDQ